MSTITAGSTRNLTDPTQSGSHLVDGNICYVIGTEVGPDGPIHSIPFGVTA